MQLLSPLRVWCLLSPYYAVSALQALGGAVLQRNTPGQREELDKRHNDAPQKYFHESASGNHYDARFDKGLLQYHDRRRHLSALARAYLSTMNDIGAETWLMHGSLLGWYWNRKIMPWDPDVDVQITEKSMQHLADHYDMTVHRFGLSGLNEGREYLLDINPNWANPSIADLNNKIDARWVDMTSGLYIDITTIRWDKQAEARGVHSAVMCKDKHRYLHKDIFPLRDTTFEGMPAKVPFAYANVLVEEYGASSLSDTAYKHHQFDIDLQEWLPVEG